jgi:hypothetical protein
MSQATGFYKGSIRKRIESEDLVLVPLRDAAGEKMGFWGLPESEIQRVWESWLITTLPDNPRWTAAIRLEPDDQGAFVAAELRVFPTERYEGDPDQDPRIRGEWSRALDAIPTGGIRARDLRRLRLADHVKEGRKAAKAAVSAHAEKLRAHAAQLGPAVDPKLKQWLDAMRPLPEPSAGRGRRVSDLDYIHVVAIYLHHCDQESSRRPAADTARDLGGDWNSEKVREWLRRARQRDLLTKVRHGTSGGRLTPKALQVLDDAQSPTGP